MPLNTTSAASVDFSTYDRVRAVRFVDHELLLLDQRELPHRQVQVHCRTVAQTTEAIINLTVRGAPAIGIAAAYGVVLSALNASGADEARAQQIQTDCDALNAARPTAVNLMWAIARMRTALAKHGPDPGKLLIEASLIESEDLTANYQMGRIGAELIQAGSGVLTHCNTGSLATAGFGTALGVIRAGYAMQRIDRVYASETRPWLQGARLTAWELLEDQIPNQLIADGAGAFLMSQGKVQWLIVGADRICANGDVANKIGTLAHAAAAKQFGVQVMVVAPSSTFDFSTPDGSKIHIEERSPNELLEYAGQRVAAANVQAWNPVFDVTPARLIDWIINEKGAFRAAQLNPNWS
jgi:methylthioribose-1-phosphate isomerase